MVRIGCRSKLCQLDKVEAYWRTDTDNDRNRAPQQGHGTRRSLHLEKCGAALDGRL